MLNLLPIVEGHGEVEAVPILLRRVCGEIYGEWAVHIRPPWRLPRSQMTKSDEMRRVSRALAGGISSSDGGVIVVLDQDDDADLENLTATVRAGIDDNVAAEIIVACREYEAWFLAGVRSLRSHKAMLDDAQFRGDPESPRNAKKQLESLMIESYSETLHQSAFSKLIDLSSVRDRSPSFEYFIQAVGRLLEVK